MSLFTSFYLTAEASSQTQTQPAEERETTDGICRAKGKSFAVLFRAQGGFETPSLALPLTSA